MLQELQMLVNNNIRTYDLELLLSYRPSDAPDTYCFYLPLTNELQHRSNVSLDTVTQLIQYLTVYAEKMKAELGMIPSQMRESDFEQQRGVSVLVDTNPTRE